MKIKKLASVKNPELETIRDNKALWNLPKTRRLGYRNLHKINRYSLYLRSDLVLRLDQILNKDCTDLFYVNFYNQIFYFLEDSMKPYYL